MRSVGKHIYRYYTLQLVAPLQFFLLLKTNLFKHRYWSKANVQRRNW
jgi:hypothetical protein